MNVVIYARYSSHSQNEQSIEGQIAVCTEFTKRNNYTIVGEYVDRALTGKTDNRPQFKKMIEDSNKKLFQGIIVYQLDRFARNRYDSATYKAKLKKNNVKVFSAKENISDDPAGILMESVLEGMAEYYSAELSEKVKRGMKINAENCKYNGGGVPLGYTINSEKKYIINEETSYFVKEIFSMYINGNSMESIAEYLNTKGIKNTFGNNFHKNGIRKILSNEKYIGIYSYGDIKIENGIPAIISKEDFLKVQEVLEKNKQAPARAKAKTEYLLTTKLFCGTCKEMMTGTCGTSKQKNIYYYYSCNGTKKKICKRKNIAKDLIENIVISEARKILTDENIEKLASEIIKLAEKEKNNNNIKALEKRLKDYENQISNLLDSLKVCVQDNVRKMVFNEISSLETIRQNIENEILYEKASQANISKEQIIFFLTQIRNGSNDDIKYKKLLINVLVNKVYIYDDKLILIFNVQDPKNSTIELPSIKDIESSFLDNFGAPKKHYPNFLFFIGGFAIMIDYKR